MSTPREEFTIASQQLTEAEKRLDADRRYLNTQLRTANRTWSLGSQVAERDDFLQPALVAERLSVARVAEAKLLREQKVVLLSHKSEAAGAG